MLPSYKSLVAAIATPVTPDLRPDVNRLGAFARDLLDKGCDGITLFGTTGEGTEFSTPDRIRALDALVASGLEPGRLIVSVGALAMPDVAALAQHAIDAGVHGVLLMPPCVYRSGIGEDGTVRYYSSVIERIGRLGLRLYLYHFPDICGVPITPRVVRRLEDRHPGVIAGVKDSGGDLEFTQDLVRRFSHLLIFTGTEVHIPDVALAGAAGTICGLANVMPRLLRAMLDRPTAYDMRQLLPQLLAGDMILSRHGFIPAVKAVIADELDDSEWRRVLPPMSGVPLLERQRLCADFTIWNESLPPACRTLTAPPPSNVIDLRRA
jgi:4-hydroxy-tetrahydrodipicolinate synthase